MGATAVSCKAHRATATVLKEHVSKSETKTETHLNSLFTVVVQDTLGNGEPALWSHVRNTLWDMIVHQSTYPSQARIDAYLAEVPSVDK